MEDIELQKMWAEYDRKLEEAKVLNLQAWALNLRSLEAMQMQKAKGKLNRLAGFKIRVVILGLAWVLLLAVLIFSKITWQGIFFNISSGCIAVITLIAIAVYIKQVMLIRDIDNSESVIETQGKLAQLQASTIRVTSILWLQLPFYSTFFLSPALLQHASPFWLGFTIVITGLLSYAAIWLYRNIHYRNRHKKWFRILFNSVEWTSVSKSMAFLDEVEEFKRNV